MTVKVLVTGATGTVGTLLVNALLESKQAEVTVISRDGKKAAAAFGAKVNVVEGSPTDKNVLAKALAGQDRVFVLAATTPTQAQDEITIIDAAVSAKVKQIVKLSAIGANISFPTGSLLYWHAVAEAHLVRTGTPFVILRPSFFHQNFLRDIGSIKGQGKIYSPQAGRIAHVDVRDIAAVGARVLTDPVENHAGLTYELTGPDSFSQEEAAAVISKVLGKKVEYALLSDAQAYATFLQYKVPAFYSHALVKLYQATRQNPSSFVAGDIEIVTGKPAISLEQWFKDNKKAFE